jgi:hypothetical protein
MSVENQAEMAIARCGSVLDRGRAIPRADPGNGVEIDDQRRVNNASACRWKGDAHRAFRALYFPKSTALVRILAGPANLGGAFA